ncbi:NAD(P)-binding protein [Novosphingobium colocasiae]
MKAEPTRRAMLSGSIGLASALTAPLALAGCSEPSIPGTLGGADWRRGHLLRDGHLPPPDGPVEDRGIVIAGGGVAGLAAAWRLKAAGYDDFTLFEMEDYVGGNARQGRNAVSAYPLGAHYLPVPNREARALRHMLEEFGMIVGEEDGAPVYDPFQLCADLEERLLWRGRWQEGLFPQGGISEEDLAQYRRFDEEMAVYRALLGSDGLHAFASPMAYSSQDPALLALDRISFADWLTHNGYTAGVLRAYLRYCCRDDYGSEPENVSAWAGLHYFFRPARLGSARRRIAGTDLARREWSSGPAHGSTDRRPRRAGALCIQSCRAGRRYGRSRDPQSSHIAQPDRAGTGRYSRHAAFRSGAHSTGRGRQGRNDLRPLGRRQRDR